jgi:hypothetical protein
MSGYPSPQFRNSGGLAWNGSHTAQEPSYIIYIHESPSTVAYCGAMDKTPWEVQSKEEICLFSVLISTT